MPVEGLAHGLLVRFEVHLSAARELQRGQQSEAAAAAGDQTRSHVDLPGAPRMLEERAAAVNVPTDSLNASGHSFKDGAMSTRPRFRPPVRPVVRARVAPGTKTAVARRRAAGAARRGVAPAAADEKGAAILAAALVLFGRYGYRRTSIDDLARETGIAKGTVYLYFATKEAIFRALCETVMTRILADAEHAARTPAPVATRLRRVLAAKFDYVHELLHGSPHAGELLDSTNRLSADLFRQADRAYLRIVVRTLDDAAARGELARGRRQLDTESAADLLVASAHGAQLDGGLPVAPRLMRRRLDDLVTVLVTALGGSASGR